jgi:hypothetical protein
MMHVFIHIEDVVPEWLFLEKDSHEEHKFIAHSDSDLSPLSRQNVVIPFGCIVRSVHLAASLAVPASNF